MSSKSGQTRPAGGGRPLPAADALANVHGLDELGRVFFCGIGGSGMSVLAGMLRQAGCPVAGSDRVSSEKTEHLVAEGIPVIIGQAAENIHDVDTVVWSSAIPADSPELVAALEQGLRLAHRSDILALLLKSHRSIAVAGTHGKTTTSSMIATILSVLGQDPSFAIGGSLKTARGTVSGGHVGTGSLMVAEADESDGSFGKYHPQIAVITNAEGDHLDHYGTVAAYRSAFLDFARQATAAVILCADDEGARQVFSRFDDGLKARTTLYSTASRPEVDRAVGGLGQAAFFHVGGEQELAFGQGPAVGDETAQVVDGAAAGPDGLGSDPATSDALIEERLVLDLYAGGAAEPALTVPVNLQVPGLHNARNAAAAIAAVQAIGLDPAAAAAALGAFLGAARRFDFQGQVGGVRLYNDYAHHPTEVSVLLDAMRRRFPGRRIRVLFQPHTYSRTKIYTRELVAALSKADDVMLCRLFAARELSSAYPGISSQTLIDQAECQGVGRRFSLVDDMFEAARTLAARSQPGDVIVTVGGGDIDRVDQTILDALTAVIGPDQSSSVAQSSGSSGQPAANRPVQGQQEG